MEATIPTQAPTIQTVTAVDFPAPKVEQLSNGVEVYIIDAPVPDIVRVEAIFRSGRRFESAPGVAAATAKLMKEGTSSMTSAQIASEIEKLGATVKTTAGFDFGTLSVYGMNRTLEDLLPLTNGLMQEATFPEDELGTYVRNTKQRIKIKEEKVDYLADTSLRKALYGATHPYGYTTNTEILDGLSRTQLEQHYKNTYQAGDLMIVVSGRVDDRVMSFLEAAFGREKRKGTTSDPWTEPSGSKEKFIHQVKEGSVQSAIRFARPLMAKTHPDYMEFFVLNILFGGYFGSRLMANIREDKGYTYGIYSGMGHMDKASHLYISSEVGIDVCKPALHEVREEMRRLREEPIPAEEMDLVRNYLTGSILGSIDGPFAIANTVKGILTGGLEMNHVPQLVDTIQKVSAVRLQELANTYLTDDITELVVGWPDES